jgi:hypothetical protein
VPLVRLNAAVAIAAALLATDARRSISVFILRSQCCALPLLGPHVVGNGLSEWSGIDDGATGGATMGEWDQWKNQFTEPIGFLEMRITGHDKCIDAEIHVLPDARGHCRRIANEGRSSAATHEAHAGP